MNIGMQILKIRKEKGLTQEEIWKNISCYQTDGIKLGE